MYEILDCREVNDREQHLKTAVAALRRGRAVVIPGESSYLLVGDAFSDSAVSRIREMKGRSNASLSVLVGSIGTADGLATGIPPYARDLMRALWPGTLTLVLRQQPSLAWPLATRKIAIRMPLHPMLLEVANAIGPIAVTTANRAGLPASAEVSEAESQFDDEVAIYLDAGRAPEMGRSSVVDVTGHDPVLVRVGETSAERITEICPTLEVPSTDQ